MKGERDRAIDNYNRVLGIASGDEVAKHFLAEVTTPAVAKPGGTPPD